MPSKTISGAGPHVSVESTDRFPASKMSSGGTPGYHEIGSVTTPLQTQITTLTNTANANLSGNRVSFSVTVPVVINLALVGGTTYFNVSVPGLLATDTIVETQLTADLPSSLVLTNNTRITANDTLRVAFSTPVALVLSSTNVSLRLTVLR